MHRIHPLLLLPLLLASCSRPEPASINHGREVVHGSLCVHCHGFKLNGTPQGPPLQGLSANWTEDRLMRYLEDPASYIMEEPRLQALTNEYRTIMPHFIMHEHTRRSVAMYLLEERGKKK